MSRQVPDTPRSPIQSLLDDQNSSCLLSGTQVFQPFAEINAAVTISGPFVLTLNVQQANRFIWFLSFKAFVEILHLRITYGYMWIEIISKMKNVKPLFMLVIVLRKRKETLKSAQIIWLQSRSIKPLNSLNLIWNIRLFMD